MPSDADYVFDLISPDSERRARAVARDAALRADFREALNCYNQLWFRAGKTPRPKDAALLAAMDQARAAMSTASDRTLGGITANFVHARSGGPGDHDRLAPYAVLFLKRENAFPDEWRTSTSGGPWHLKKRVLKRFVEAGVPVRLRSDLIRLIAAAIEREHRCEDGGFAAVARAVDGAELRCALEAADTMPDSLVRLNAQYVRWIVDHPTAPVTVAGWRRWLASDECH